MACGRGGVWNAALPQDTVSFGRVDRDWTPSLCLQRGGCFPLRLPIDNQGSKDERTVPRSQSYRAASPEFEPGLFPQPEKLLSK